MKKKKNFNENLMKKTKKSGWVHENSGERFYLGDSGQYVTNDWYKDGDKWYWFDGNGHMVADVWYQYKGSWYYLSQDGSMAKGLQAVDGKWYYLDPANEGAMVADVTMIIDGVSYTFDGSGVMQ